MHGDTNPETVTVRYHPALTRAAVAGGVVSVVVGWLLLPAALPILLVPALSATLLAVRYHRRHYIRLSAMMIVLVPPLSREREIKWRSTQVLTIEAAELVIVDPYGKFKQNVARRWIAHPDDWQTLAATVDAPNGKPARAA